MKIINRIKKFIRSLSAERTPVQCKKCEYVIYRDISIWKMEKPRYSGYCTLRSSEIPKKQFYFIDWCCQKNPNNDCPKDLSKMKGDLEIYKGCSIAYNRRTNSHHCLKCNSDIPPEIIAHEHVCDKEIELERVNKIKYELATWKEQYNELD